MNLTKEEILAAKYANDKWEPNFNGILEVMDIWAEIYHKEKLREELYAFRKFYNERYQEHPDLYVADILRIDINDYLKQKQ